MGTMQRRKREAKDRLMLASGLKAMGGVATALTALVSFDWALRRCMVTKENVRREALGLPEPERIAIELVSRPADVQAMVDMLGKMNDDLAARGLSVRIGS